MSILNFAERWLVVSGFEGRYEVSDQGRVRSVPFMQRYLLRNGVEAFRQTKQKIVAQQMINSGYLIVHLHKDGKRKAKTVHRLVAAAFVPGGGRTVNHRDGVKPNNLFSNLEWATYPENLDHAVEMGLNVQAVRVAHPATGRIYPSISKAAKAAHHSHRHISANWARP